MTDRTEKKRELVEGELARYLGETYPALLARCHAASTAGLAPPLLRDLAVRLQVLEDAKNETNCEFRALLEGGVPTETVLDHALASLEHLSEIAGALMRHMDEVLGA